MQTIFLLISFFGLFVQKCTSSCYFALEFQGAYVTQGTVTHDNTILYSEVNITDDAVPIWGNCHKRIENNVILMISSEETTCFRCFNLKLVSRNILRVLTTDPDYISKCYTNEEKAELSCPHMRYTETLSHSPHVQDGFEDEETSSKITEIILYKTHEIDGQEVRRTNCPINGRYHLNYNIDDGHDDAIECPTIDSGLDNCPSGSAMNIRFRKCSFENHDLTFECLGHWESPNGQHKYVALKNTQSPATTNIIQAIQHRSGTNHPRQLQHRTNVHLKDGPQYRCAIYDEDKHSGTITLSFSKDSTCTAINRHPMATNKAEALLQTETLTLYPADGGPGSWPHLQYCQFPDWMQGNWQDLTVTNDTAVFRDPQSYKAYTMRCVENLNDTLLTVYSRTQCDESFFQCLDVKYRSSNIIEFQIQDQKSPNYSLDLCQTHLHLQHSESDDETVGYDYYSSRWLTQGRLDSKFTNSVCPISGDFSGMIPDASNLCAKLSSDCKSEDTMYYQVSSCEYGEVYEDRKYQCLGQWHENDLLYTYTKRLDVGTYECFVGARSSESQFFIKEAGEHCQRNMDPYRYGMELNKIGSCNQSVERTAENPSAITTEQYNQPHESFEITKNSTETNNSQRNFDAITDHYYIIASDQSTEDVNSGDVSLLMSSSSIKSPSLSSTLHSNEGHKGELIPIDRYSSVTLTNFVINETTTASSQSTTIFNKHPTPSSSLKADDEQHNLKDKNPKSTTNNANQQKNIKIITLILAIFLHFSVVFA